MGLPMAKNLAAATAGSEGGGEVHVYDLNAGAVSDAPRTTIYSSVSTFLTIFLFLQKEEAVAPCILGGSGNGGSKDGILSVIRGISRRCTCN